MKLSDELFILIKSLSKSEKRYFKIALAKKEEKLKSNSLRLFEEMDKMTVYDEKLLHHKFSASKFIRHLPSEMNHLYTLILKSLNMYNRTNSNYSQLTELVQGSKTLYDRGLLDQSGKLLNKALFVAEDEEIYPEFFNITVTLIDYVKTFSKSSRELEQKLNDIFRNEDRVKKKMEVDHEFLRLFSRHLHLLWSCGEIMRSKSDSKELDAFMKHPLLQNEHTAITFRSKRFFYFITSSYYYASCKFTECFAASKKALKQAEANLGKRIGSSTYSTILYNHAEFCLRAENYLECYRTFEKIKSLFKNDKRVGNKHYYFPESLGLRLMINTGKFDEAAQLALQSASILEEGWHPTDLITIRYFASYAFLGNGNFKDALKHLNELLKDRSGFRPDLLSCARILNLILHFELGNYLQIEYLIRSTLHYLKKHNKLYAPEKLFLKFIKKAIQFPSRDKLPALYKGLKEKLKGVFETPQDRAILEYFDYLSWVESKIQNKPLGQIIRTKVGMDFKF